MDIISKLKKEKKPETVFDALIKKKEIKEAEPTKPPDVEVTQLTPDKAPTMGAKTIEPQEKPLKREFRTEGMHEFDIESLGVASDANIKVEYKAKVTTLIDEGKFDEAIELLKELKDKLAQK